MVVAVIVGAMIVACTVIVMGIDTICNAVVGSRYRIMVDCKQIVVVVAANICQCISSCRFQQACIEAQYIKVCGGRRFS